MGCPPNLELPTIDLSKEHLKPGTSLWLSTCDMVRGALEEYGCFVAVFNKVSLELQNAVFSASKEFFELPVETKTKHNSEWPYYGYVSHNSLLERFSVKDADALEATERYTKLMWPDGNDRFCDTMYSYSKTVIELDQLVRLMVLESYGVEKYYDSHIKPASYVLRLAKYRKLNIHETDIRLRPHTDKTFITILTSNQVSGLEIKTRDGEWIVVPSTPSSFMVFAGEAILAWSNDRIHAPIHQVRVRESQDRYSVTLFSFNNKTIEVPEELVDVEHPLQFKPFDNVKLLELCLTEAGHKEDCTVKAFYSV